MNSTLHLLIKASSGELLNSSFLHEVIYLPGNDAIQQSGLNDYNTTSTYILAILILISTVLLWKIIKKGKRINSIIKRKTGKLTSEVKRLEQENDTLEMLSSVALHAENGVIITDNEGEIEWVNPGFTRMTGFTLSKLKEERGSTVFEASYSPHIVNIINNTIAFKKSITYETNMFTKYDKKLWISSLITPIFAENGTLKRIVIIDTDISIYNKSLPKEIQDIKNRNLSVYPPLMKNIEGSEELHDRRLL